MCAVGHRVTHFHVTAGYLPDVAHDDLEGIIPVELAHCFCLLISKKYFTNRPHTIAQTLSVNKNISGNAHENCLLRLLLLIIGPLIPKDEPTCNVLISRT